jgi:neutral ceramidase
VRVDDRKGRPIAVWSNFAIHATSFGDGNLLFSGDNPGVAEQLVEEDLARRANGRDVVNVWTNGNEGDISPNGDADRLGDQPVQHAETDFARAHLAGRRVADGVLRAWRAAGAGMTAAPRLDARRSFLAFDGTQAGGEPVGPLQVLGGGIVQDGLCAPIDGLAGPGQGRKFPGLTGVGLVPGVVPVSMWRVGGLGVAAIPSEVTKQMGERIRRALEAGGDGAYDRVALAGLTNAYVSYTATPS